MTVRELMAAFKASNRSLSTRPHHHSTPPRHDMRTPGEYAVETKTPTAGRPEQAEAYAQHVPTPMSHRTVTDAESHEVVERVRRTRKPTPCRCSCNSDAPTAKPCSGFGFREKLFCGHKGCRFAP